MIDPRRFCPQPPEWRLDWDALADEYPWVAALRGCEQDPEWHAEGDVWIHTRMVLEALVQIVAWRDLPVDERAAVFCASLLHDVAKPATTRRDADGRITARGHSRQGAIAAREILWRAGVGPAEREPVCHLIRHHQVPFFFQDDERLLARISWTTRADHLALVAEADARGRHCHDQQRLLDNIEWFREFARDRACFAKPRPFLSGAHRFEYFRSATRPADAPVAPEAEFEAIVMSGLPGAGKDTWIAAHAGGLPVVSLDALRAERKVRPEDSQRGVIDAARARARELLRAKTSFVWNATNLSDDVRGQVIDLCAGYGARVRVVYVETSPEEWVRRNQTRRARVPESALARMLRRWQVPDGTEAHRLEHIVT